jgi:hypothetical protein
LGRVGGYLVGTSDTLDGLLSDLYQRSGARPASSFVQPMGFLDAMRYAVSCTNLTTAQCHLPAAGGQLGRESFVASSRVLTAPVGDTGTSYTGHTLREHLGLRIPSKSIGIAEYSGAH